MSAPPPPPPPEYYRLINLPYPVNVIQDAIKNFDVRVCNSSICEDAKISGLGSDMYTFSDGTKVNNSLLFNNTNLGIKVGFYI
jgi:hypothetical protein